MSRYPSKPPSEGRGKAKPSRGEAIFIIYPHDDPKPSAGRRLTDLLVMIMFMTMDKIYHLFWLGPSSKNWRSPPSSSSCSSSSCSSSLCSSSSPPFWLSPLSISWLSETVFIRNGFTAIDFWLKGFLFKIVHVKNAKLNDEFTLPWWFIIRGFGAASSFSSSPSSLRIKLFLADSPTKEKSCKIHKRAQAYMIKMRWNSQPQGIHDGVEKDFNTGDEKAENEIVLDHLDVGGRGKPVAHLTISFRCRSYQLLKTPLNLFRLLCKRATPR